jgi:spore germination protein KC
MVKRILVVSLILSLFLSAGCWNRREPESYAWLTWIGMDRAEGEKIQITAAVSPALSPVPTGAAPPEKLLLVSSVTGDSAFEAVRNLTSHIPKRLFWGYLQALIVSEDIARSGMEQYLDFVFRDHEGRKNAWVFITRGPTEPVFKIEPQIEKSPGKLISDLVKAEQGAQGKSRVVRVKDLQYELEDPGIDPVVSVLGVWDPEKKKILDPGEKPPKKSELALAGSAVFRGDKLVGWLSEEESQALLFAKGELKGGLVVIPHPDDPRNKAGIEILKSKKKLKAKLTDDQVKVSLEINIKGHLGDQVLNVPGRKLPDPAGDPKLFLNLADGLEQKLKSDIQKLLDKSQSEFEADILGVGDYIRTRYPKDWERVRANWREVYKSAEFELEVKATITAPGTMRARYPVEEEDEKNMLSDE